jgi:hypothetical protein
MMILTQFAISTDATAELAIPLIVALGAFGLITGWSAGLLNGRLPTWEIGSALGVYLVFAAPIVLSGEPTWAGYIKLDDTATWMGLTDHAFEFGRHVGGLPPSTYEALVAINAGNGYPVGSFVPMALMGKLVDQDIAWTIQPSMAIMAAILTLLLAELTRPVLRRVAARAAVAFLAGQSAMLLGYSLWGGVKEVAAATLLALGPLLGWQAIVQERARFPWLLPAIPAAAFLTVLGPGGAVWLVPTLLPLLYVAWRRLEHRRAFALAWKSLVALLVATLPQLITPNGFFNPFQKFLFEATELGNLPKPLSLIHVMGIWPAEDFRYDPHLKVVVTLAVVTLTVLAGFAAYTAVRDRDYSFSAYAIGGGVAFLMVYAVGSPWIDGKAMTIISPGLLMAGLTGVALMIERTPFRIEGWIVGAIAAGLIGWSSFLAYHGVWLAPRAEHIELQRIGDRFAGRGPALMTEGSIYGTRHFLRRLDAEGAKDLRRNQVTLRDGSLPDNAPYVDLDMIAPGELARYRLLVFRRSPVTSRPGGDFRLAYAGKYYEVWERTASPTSGKVDHLPLGEPPEDSAVPDCAAVEALAARSGPRGVLVAARPRDTQRLDLRGAAIPQSWASDPGLFWPRSAGMLTTDISVGTAGEYTVWIGGDIYDELQVSIGGHTAPAVRDALNTNGYEPIGPFHLDAGSQTMTITSHGSDLHPGSATSSVTPLGPVILERIQPADRGTVTVPGSDSRALCNQRWDWIEAFS